jgi:L-lactate dehydrogenase complex protein LldF
VSALYGPPGFEERSREQLAKPFQRIAIPRATDHAAAALRERFEGLDYEGLRTLGAEIRDRAIRDLDAHVDAFAARVEERGGVVHRATDARAAREIVASILRERGARVVVKSKSMVSEEVELNGALLRDGVEVVETDLGEYVVQLDGDRPSHVIAPIVHKTRGEVRATLSKVAGRELPDDPSALIAFAREQLRGDFLRADAGISGANFGVAETGTICLVTNEGNGRMATSLPRLHIALMGIERVVPRLEDLSVLLPLLTGAGTGQRISGYVTLLDGPRRADEPDGPDELHVVLVDNGRSAVARSEYAEVLRCIRCGACQNVCPVFRQVGGHAYGWVYGGPIGAVLTPLFLGQETGGELSHATSLCGACDDICPVRIPLHELLLRLRRERVRAGVAPRAERLAFAAWSYVWSDPRLYRLSALAGARLAPLARRAPRLAGPIGRWARGRRLPVLARTPFHRRGAGR